MPNTEPLAYIYDAIRTPRGKAKADGALAALSPFDLLNTLYQQLGKRNDITGDDIEEVALGCVTQAGEQAANIAKTSVMYSDWPSQTPAITLNRYCASGLDAVAYGALKVHSGFNTLVAAGGVEMMSRVPMLSDNARAFTDPALASRLGLYMMGSGADLIATRYQVSREQADHIAFMSHQRAAQAQVEGRFRSIVPVANPATNSHITTDELIRPDTTVAKLAQLPAAFAELGTKGIDDIMLRAYPELNTIQHVHTVGNSPAMADAAALVLVGNKAVGDRLQKPPRAAITAYHTTGDDPHMVVSGCVLAAQELMKREQLDSHQIDLFEIHEAFAATMIKTQRDLKIDDSRLNVNGGCIALGHPLGATGAIMLGTLIDEMECRDVKRGLVALSGAGGSGTAMLIERQ